MKQTIGVNSIISKNIRLRCPEHFVVGDYSIIDDFCYFSTKVKIGKCSHIASGCSIAGGSSFQFTLGDYSSISAGVKIWCVSDDFVNDIVTIFPPQIIKLCGIIKNHLIAGDVTLGDFTAVGANSVIMPNNKIPDGTVIGSLSFVPEDFRFKPWSVYAGIPIRLINIRNRGNVISQVKIVESGFKRLKLTKTK